MNLPSVQDKTLTPLQITLRSILYAMQTDYPERFKSRFKEQNLLDEFKKRLFQKVKDFNINDIADGYELWIDSDRGKSFLPTIPELVECIEQIESANKKNKFAEIEASRIAALPKPTMIVNPSELFLKAKEAAKKKAELTKDQRNELIIGHESLIRTFGDKIKKHNLTVQTHGCNVQLCRKLGTLSDNLRGSGPWYCLYHSKMI